MLTNANDASDGSPPGADFLAATQPLMMARRRMMATGQWNTGQFIGRRWPIGCVALEIAQRCNLGG
jgi:hypothetical protein